MISTVYLKGNINAHVFLQSYLPLMTLIFIEDATEFKHKTRFIVRKEHFRCSSDFLFLSLSDPFPT